MGLGGVAIAVLPSVVYPQTVVLGQAGGVSSGSCQKSKIISAECGFSCRTHLYRIFKKKEGCSPTEWRAFQSTDAAQKDSN